MIREGRMKGKVFAVAALCLAGLCAFAGCGAENANTEISVDEDGYLVVNGDKTDVLISQTPAKDGEDGKAGKDGKSAYELFLEENPMYDGDEAQWLDDLTSGKLAAKKEYSILSYGRNLAATVQEGDVSYAAPTATTSASVSTTSAVLALQTPVILPLEEESEWSVAIEGTINATGGQFLTSYANGLEGRVYLGVNHGNSILFMGVYLGGDYMNYCWSVDQATISSKHTYEFRYSGGEYLLLIDGGEAKHLASINIGQSNITTVTDPVSASAELTGKIRAVTGQNFVKMTHIGTTTQKNTSTFESYRVTTSSIYRYRELSAHPLRDKTIYYLGSSVTRGHGGNTDGTSFADLTATLTGNSYRKEAISGTYLATVSDRTNSYVERLANFDFTQRPDVLVFQLSTNDFSNGLPVGSIGAGKSSSAFDTATITGAIEYIIAKVHEQSPDTKVVLYTCTVNGAYGKYNEYSAFVNGMLKQIEKKWNGTLSVLDLLNTDYISVAAYMQADGVHPNKSGFGQVYMPAFINLLLDII